MNVKKYRVTNEVGEFLGNIKAINERHAARLAKAFFPKGYRIALYAGEKLHWAKRVCDVIERRVVTS